jgi:hypothetical protein
MFQMLIVAAKHFGVMLLAIVAPVLAIRRANHPWWRIGLASFHSIAMLLVAGGLLVVQQKYELDQYIRTTSWLMRQAWLPLIATMVYCLAWSCWYLAKILRTPNHAHRQKAISAAWHTASDRLSRAGIDIRQTPLFLTLGHPEGGIQHFMSAAGFPLTIPPTPNDDDAPLRICGNQQGLFLCCDRVSLLDEFVDRVEQQKLANGRGVESGGVGSASESDCGAAPAHQWEPSRASATHSSATHSSASSSSASRSMPPTAASRATGIADASGQSSAVATAPTQNVAAHPLAGADLATTARMQESLDLLQSQVEQAVGVIQPTPCGNRLTDLDAETAAAIEERLEHVCHLLTEHRAPYCPLNGIVVMVPVSVTDDAEVADHVAMRIERDLQTIVDNLQTSLSVQVILTGLEQCEGAKPLLARFPDQQRHRRLGAVIPMAPASEPDAQATLIDQSSQWMCEQLFPPLVARLIQRSPEDRQIDLDLQAGNARLYQFVRSMRGRRQVLSRMLRRMISANQRNLWLRGCFFVATGEDAVRGHAFAAGVMPMILGSQNEVRWQPKRRSRDQWQWAAAIAGYATIIAATIAVVCLFIA